MKTRRDLLKVLFWGRSEIALMTGCSSPTAKRTLQLARDLCTSKGHSHPYENKVYNKYVLEILGLDFDYMEKTGLLESEIVF